MPTHEDHPRIESPPGADAAEEGGAPLPAWASLLLLVGLIAGVSWWSLSLGPRLAPTSSDRSGTAALTIVRDVLTNRLTDERGVPETPRAGWGSPDHPLRLRFVPSSDVGQDSPAVDELMAFLRRRTGYVIEGTTLRSYGLVVQEIVQGKCEVAFLTAASYARARYATENNEDPDDDIDAILQVVRRGSPEHAGSDLAYRAALIVRTDSALRRVTDITDDTVVAMGSRVSGASSILPTAHFRRLDLHPRIHRLEGYPIIVNAVLQGAADVGCVWWSSPNEELPRNDARLLVLESNPDVFDRTRILDLTPWIPNEPVVVRKALPEPVRRILARALSLYVVQRTLTEEGRRELVAVGSPVGLIPASNDDFRALMEVIEQAFADDPEGRRDFMAGSK